MRGDCLFCWYWLNWWPSLIKLSFHNIFRYASLNVSFWICSYLILLAISCSISISFQLPNVHQTTYDNLNCVNCCCLLFFPILHPRIQVVYVLKEISAVFGIVLDVFCNSFYVARVVSQNRLPLYMHCLRRQN